jgi:hypothetical protein
MMHWLISMGVLGTAHAERLPHVEMLIRRGQYRLAVTAANALIDEQPDNADLYASLGIAWAKNSFYADALGAFSLSMGSSYYEVQGLEAHADALRAVGQGEAAAALRLEFRVNASASNGRLLRILLGAADDLRSVGDISGAAALLDEAESIFPRSPMLHAVRADLLMDTGELDAVDITLAHMKEMGETSRGAAVLARRALLAEDYAEADAALENARKFRTPTHRLASLRAEVLRLEGDPHSAAEVLERNRWQAIEAPELIQVRLKVYADLEDTTSAAYWEHMARSRYGENHLVQDGLSYLESSRL